MPGPYYWVGGTGNWSDATNHWATASGGTPNAANTPLSTDNVIFDASSSTSNAAYTLTVDTTSNCADLTMAGPGAGNNITWAGSAALNIYGSMSLTAGTADLTRTYSGAITFASTSTGKTINTNGVTLNSTITFNGVGGGWTLAADLSLGNTSSAKAITLTAGTLDTSGYAVSCGSFVISGSTTRTLTLGASTISVYGVGVAWSAATTTNLTFNSNTSTINCGGIGGASNTSFDGGGLTYNNVVWYPLLGNVNATMTGANTFSNFTITGHTSVTSNTAHTLGANITVTGTFTVTAVSERRRVFVRSDTTGTQRTITAAAISLQYIQFKDIVGAGAASWNISAITGNSSDAGNNSGITFTTAATQNWTNTSGGSWSDAANWSTRVPLAQDDVTFNCVFTTSRTVTVDLGVLGKSISFASATWTTSLTLALSSPTFVYGNFTLITGLTTSGSSAITFAATGSWTMDTKGVSFASQYNFDTSGATCTLLSDFTATSTVGFVIDRAYTFDADAYNVNVVKVTCSGNFTRNLYMGSGTWTLSGTATVWSIAGSGFTLYSETSTIKLTDSSTAGKTFAGSGLSYNNIWFSGTGTGIFTITGANTFNNLKVDNPPHQVVFPSGSTTTVTSVDANGSSGLYNTFYSSSTSGSNFTLAKAGGGTVTVNYISIIDCTASPTSTWYGDTYAIDGGRGANTNWTFAAAPSDPAASTSQTLYDACTSNNVATNFVADGRTLFVYNTTDYAGTLTNNNVQYLIERNNIASGVVGVKATINKNRISTFDVGECDIALGDYDATRSAWFAIDNGLLVYLTGTGTIKIYHLYGSAFHLLSDTGFTMANNTDYVLELYVFNETLVLKIDTVTYAIFRYTAYTPNTKTVYSFSTYGNASSYATTLKVKNIYDIFEDVGYISPFPAHRWV